jgi:hypothetical protein
MEAEFLVFGDLPASVIRGYVVYDATAEASLLAFGVTQKQVIVRPTYYF